VEIRPLRGELNPGPDGPSRQAALQIATHASPRGFFELAGLAPGQYAVTIRHPRYAPAHLSPVEVHPLAETELSPVRLQPPVVIEVQVEPPVEPGGSHWVLTLSREDLGGGHYTEVRKGAASADGGWRVEGLEPAAYRLEVEGGYASRWAQVAVDVHAGMAPVEVRLPFVEVEGRVRMGADPLQALLWFGGSHGVPRVAARSDRQGRFSVVLPEQPAWRVEVVNQILGVWATLPEVEVRKAPGGEWAKMAIEVPDTTVKGSTVDESGNAVKARIRAASGSVKPYFGATEITSDAAGKFEVKGLAPGRWGFEAADGDRTSDNVALQVSESAQGPDLQLVLRRRVKLSGEVVDPGGNPIYAAQVFASFPGWGTLTSHLPETTTDVSGVFKLSLPAGIGAVTLSVFPPGFAVRQVVVDPHSHEALVVPVSPDGGDLVVELSNTPIGSDSRLRLTSIFHQSYLPPVFYLDNWARLHGLSPADETRLEVPSLEPGIYTACFGIERWSEIGDPTPLLRDPRCASGELTAGGTLVLKPAATKPGTPPAR